MLRKSLDFDRKNCAHTAESGFTLVEMMIVVAIIAILSALVIPRVNNQLNETRRVATISDLNAVNTVWTSYLLMTGRSMGVSEPVITPGDMQLVSASDLGHFLQTKVPAFDHFGHQIEYRVDAWPDPNVLVARSPGKDGVFETSYEVDGPNQDPPPCSPTLGDIVIVNGITLYRLRNPPCWPTT
ncbi:MAG: prepilin-type N-terminal cleavage/methylation domain-containing protein [Thermoanaerobaculia bacterium]